MSQAITAVNPFIYGSPIREARDFYGRKGQLYDIFEQISKGGCVNVVGERRIGKTSFLFHLNRPSVREQHLSQEVHCIFAYVDAQICPQDPQEFFREIFVNVKEQHPELSISPRDADMNEACVRSYLRSIQPYRLVLLVDEFERITQSPDFPSRFFIFLRGLAASYAVSLIICTCRPLVETCSPEVISSPFPNIFGHLQLGAFTADELDEFLADTSERGGLLMPQIRSQIVALAGYFPYFVQLACWHYFRLWQESGSLTPNDHRAVKRRFLAEATPHFDAIWNRYLGEDEKRVMLRLAEGRDVAEQHLVWQLGQKGYLADGQISSQVFGEYARGQRDQIAAGSSTGTSIPDNGIYVDSDSGNAYVDGGLIDPPLPKYQFRLLKLLYENKGKICTFYKIVESVWSEDYIDRIDDQRIAQLISRLRRRVEPHGKPWKYILTVRGRGLTLGDG